jgi:CubicO group peptidase (beta-lactamase class C family)
MLRSRAFACLFCLALLTLILPGCDHPDRFAAVPPVMQTYVDMGQVSGIVTLVADKDQILFQSAVGTSDGTRKMQPDDLFWIASMGKPITAVAAAMLVDDGKLKFDDRVDKYIPEFRNLRLYDGNPLSRPILLRDLLNHTAGLPYNYDVTQPHWTLQQYARQIASQPLEFQPGTDWYYSNAGIDVVGYIVQVASGIPFDQFLQQRLFDPLGMKDTTFWLTPDDVRRHAHAYAVDPQTRKLVDRPFAGLYGTELTDRQRAPLGAAGLFSTAHDLARFYQMMLNHGQVGDRTILKPQTVAEMTTNQIGTLTAGRGLAWGYGFTVITDPAGMPADAMLSPGTFGHVGLYGTNSWADPQRNIIYVILLERADIEDYLDSPMRTQFQSLASQALAQN